MPCTHAYRESPGDRSNPCRSKNDFRPDSVRVPFDWQPIGHAAGRRPALPERASVRRSSTWLLCLRRTHTVEPLGIVRCLGVGKLELPGRNLGHRSGSHVLHGTMRHFFEKSCVIIVELRLGRGTGRHRWRLCPCKSSRLSAQRCC